MSKDSNSTFNHLINLCDNGSWFFQHSNKIKEILQSNPNLDINQKTTSGDTILDLVIRHRFMNAFDMILEHPMIDLQKIGESAIDSIMTIPKDNKNATKILIDLLDNDCPINRNSFEKIKKRFSNNNKVMNALFSPARLVMGLNSKMNLNATDLRLAISDNIKKGVEPRKSSLVMGMIIFGKNLLDEIKKNPATGITEAIIGNLKIAEQLLSEKFSIITNKLRSQMVAEDIKPAYDDEKGMLQKLTPGIMSKIVMDLTLSDSIPKKEQDKIFSNIADFFESDVTKPSTQTATTGSSKVQEKYEQKERT